MPREVKINVNVDSGKAVSNINTLKKAFQELNKVLEKNGKEGSLKLKIKLDGIDTGVLNNVIKSITKLNTSMSKLKKTSSDFNDMGKVFNITTNHIINTTSKAKKNIDDYSKSTNKFNNTQKKLNDNLLSSLVVFESLRRGMMYVADGYTKLSYATFGVGIAGGMNLSEIDKLNDSFIQLSLTVPQTAIDLAKAVDDLIRTGRTYEDSRKIIEETAKLATSSGDSLKDTAQVVTKVVVSLGISGDRIKDTLDTMHSTAIQTASDMGYLAEAFKNVAGTTAVFVKGTGLVGKELDDYKQKILDLSMASIGSLANLGLSASQSGTKVKQLFGRMVSAEKVAKNMFDTTMKLQNVKVGDKIFNYDMLSQIAQSDLPKALETMSKLYIEGKLSSQVLQKMFTARHFMEISNLLLEINGDINGFINGIASGVNYSDDLLKKTFDINEQLKLFRNNVNAGLSTPLQDATESLTGLLMLMNNSSETFSKLVNIVTKIASPILVSAGALTSIGAIMKVIVPLAQQGSFLFTKMLSNVVSIKVLIKGMSSLLMSPLGVLSLIIAGTGSILKYMVDIKKEAVDTTLLFNSLPKTVDITNQQLSKLNTKLDVVRNTIKDSNKLDLSSELDNSSTLLDSLLSKFKDLYDVLKTNENWKLIDTKSSLEELDIIRNQRNEIEKYVSYASKQLKQAREFLSKDYFNNPKKIIGYGGDKVQKLIDKYLELTMTSKDSTEALEGLKDYAKELNIMSFDAERIIANLDTKDIEMWTDKIKEAQQSIKDLSQVLQEKLNTTMKQVQDNLNAFNKNLGHISNLRLELFEKTSEITLGDNTYKGVEGIFQIMFQGEQKKIELQRKEVENQIEQIKENISTIETLGKSSLLGLSKEDKQRIDEGKNQIKEFETWRDNLKIAGDDLRKRGDDLRKSLGSLFEGIDYNKETSPYIIQMSAIKTTLENLKAQKEKNVEQIASLEVMLGLYTSLAKETSKEVKAKENASTYQLKLVTYTKENLQLELELAKLGVSREKQAYLEYYYKTQTLKVNKELALSDVQSMKETLKMYEARTTEGQKYISQALKSNNLNSVEDVIKSFWKKHSGIITGKTGKDLKSDYDMLVQYLKVLKEADTAGIKFGVAVQQGINSVQDIALSQTLKIMSEDSIRYLKPYVNKLKEEVIKYKNQISNEFFSGENFDINTALSNSMKKIDLLSQIKGDKGNLSKLSEYFKSLFGDSWLKVLLDSENFAEDLAILTQNIVAENEALLKLKKMMLDTDKEEVSLALKQLEAYQSLATVLGKMGDIFGIGALGDLGEVINAFKDVKSFMADPKNNFDFGKIFDPKAFADEAGKIDWSAFSDNFSNAMKSVFEHMSMGNAVGNLVGGFIGGTQGASQAGALAGMVTGAMDKYLTGWQGLAVQTGASLIGGLFDKSGNDQEEAERRTKEANKIYNKNTEALQKLSQNMSNLNGGVDGLNSTLISSFSKIPTVGNLNRVTDAMTSMYKTMEKTRIFDNVAYQVTKTKKSKGFLGIGGGSTSWTETIEVSVEEMLNKYGFKGAIEDMTSQQLRDFSKWLDDFDMGDSDNFSILADAIENYAEALDKMEKNIENFFYDTTMESFEGISSLQQEDLRQQIEDFYKSLGLQIDDSMLEQIDKLAEEMSVMVTIMQDVRGDFISSWRDSGVDAGKAFVGSMKPYIDAILTNISQIYYDVYFSDINKELETQFKSLSEKLVELKKQGEKLNWKDVSKELSNNFETIINTINSAKNETESFNTILLELQKQALDSGLSLSEIFELGLVTGTQNTVIETFKDSLMSSEADSAFTSIGNMVGDTIGKALVDKMIDNLLSDKVLEFSAQLDKIVSGSMNFDQLAGLAMEAQSIGMMMESERLRLEAIKDLFNFDKDITYQNQDTNIEYKTGVSSQIVNNYYLSSSVEAGNVIESDSIERLADELLDIILEKLKVDKGITLK